MDEEERSLIATAAWMFALHGRRDRAKPLLEAILEETPSDGVAAGMLADILLAEGDFARALGVVRLARFPKELARAEALLETRALKGLGRGAEAASRWSRYLEAAKGAARRWV